MELLQSILPEHFLAAITMIVALCAAITTVLPAPKDGGNAAYRILYQVIQWVALNLGRARNAQDANPINHTMTAGGASGREQIARAAGEGGFAGVASDAPPSRVRDGKR